MSVIKVNNITNLDGTSGPVIAGITTVSSTSHFVVPTGRTGTRFADEGENIVRNGLVMYLDAKHSYPSRTGIGTTTSGAAATPGSSLEGEPYIWYDMSGYENNGQLNNQVGYSTANGGSLLFDGVNDFINFGNIFNFTTEDFSFNIFFYLTSLTTSTVGQAPVLFYKGSYQVNGYYIQLGSSNPSSTNFITNQSGANQVTTSTLSLIVGAWNNLSVTRSGSSVKIYINGVDATASAGTHINPTSSTDNFVLSSYNSASIFSNIRIASFQVYNRTLSAIEVLQNFNAVRSRFGL